MEKYNRFFIGKTSAEPRTPLSTPEQLHQRINSLADKVDKLCLVKGNTGDPQQAALTFLELKGSINAIMQASPKLENTSKHEETLTSSI